MELVDYKTMIPVEELPTLLMDTFYLLNRHSQMKFLI